MSRHLPLCPTSCTPEAFVKDLAVEHETGFAIGLTIRNVNVIVPMVSNVSLETMGIVRSLTRLSRFSPKMSFGGCNRAVALPISVREAGYPETC